MAYHEEAMDYAVGINEMGEVDEDMYFAGRIMGESESDEEDEDEDDHLVSSIYSLINIIIENITFCVKFCLFNFN